LNFNRIINNISSLQTFQLLRFISFTIISIYFTKSTLSIDDIGDYEFLLFVASAVSFFWVTGIIQSLLPLYNGNKIFYHDKSRSTRRSPEIFNAFWLISFFSILVVLILLFLRKYIYVYTSIKPIPHSNLLLIYILLSNPACLVEYIYLLRNKGLKILSYGFYTFALQTLAVCLPVVFGYGLTGALYGLIGSSVFRILWLVVMLFRYAQFQFSMEYLKAHFKLGVPLILSTLLSGSAQYIDGIIVSSRFSPMDFAYFRYGAKEMPLVVMLASGLNNAMLPEFYSDNKVQSAIKAIKDKSRRLMHILFPLTIILMIYSNDIYYALFTRRFSRSADVFMVYLLLITSRMLFPQTILIGMKKTGVVMIASIIEIILNIGLSLYLIPRNGIVGVAVATVVVYWIEKIILVGYNYFKYKIKPQDYTPLKTYLIYSLIIITLFILIDRRIIMLPRR
jgi:O-antigen/teichoic acid export membrane protein